jgi:hypothetical protein
LGLYRLTLPALATLVLAVPFASARPSLQIPLTVRGESYGWRDKPTDPDLRCLDEDDTLDWWALGDLPVGASFTFRPQHLSCQWRVTRGTFAYRGPQRRDRPRLEVTLTADLCVYDGTEVEHLCPPRTVAFTDDGNVYRDDCGFAKWCYRGGWEFRYTAGADSLKGSWTLTVTNIGTVDASDVYLVGIDRQQGL